MDDDRPKKLFVAMPFGERESCLDDRKSEQKLKINFNEVWEGILFPAIPNNFVAKRADELQESGIIDQLYIQWLLEADVVLADLTFGNPNVYYELGIRQALSKRGTVLVAQTGTVLPFDIASQNVLTYDCFNAASLHKFQSNLTERIMNASLHEKDSPVHIFLPGLFVGRYEGNENPEFINEQLRYKVNELEIEIGKLKKREQVERSLRKINNSDDTNQLLAIYFYELKQSVSSIEILESLAIKLRKFGKIKEALNLLKRADDLYPNDFEILRELGFCCRKLGEEYIEDAKNYFTQAISLNDSDPELHGMIGGMLKRQGKYGEALEYYKKAHSLVADDLYSLVNLGAISILLRNNGDAEKYYETVLELCYKKIENGTADYWTYLCQGEAEVALNKETHLKAYENALNFNPPVEDVRSASEQLEIFVSFGFQKEVSSTTLNLVLYPYLRRY